MRIGLVFDLREAYRELGLTGEDLAEFDRPETLEALERAMGAAGWETVRIGNVRALAQALVAGERWDLVFNIAEGLKGRGREAQVPGLLEAFDQPYLFSDPLAMALSLDKALCKRLVRDAGVPTAPFALLENEEDLRGCGLSFPLFLKPVAEGSGKGCSDRSRVEDAAGLLALFRTLRHRFDQPVLAEAYLPGREFTVGIVGNGDAIRLHAVAEILFPACDSHGIYSCDTKEFSSSRVVYRPVADREARRAAEHALVIHRLLGCRDASRLDFRSDRAGEPCFLEINPLAGLHPTLSGLPILAGHSGVDYDGLIRMVVESGLERLGRG